MTKKDLCSWLWVVLTLALMSALMLGCGGGKKESSSAEPTVERLAATPLITHVFEQPTSIITLPAPEEKTPTPASAGSPDLALGERVYTNRRCAECHGVEGAGVEGKGNALAGTPLSEEEFEDILRTGRRGELGNEHLFGPQAISPKGMAALYAYVKSFPAP